MPSYDFLTKAIAKEMQYYGIPGCAIGIIREGQVEYLNFGYADVERAIKFTPDTISGIGSCTKSMTAFAVLRLAERGAINLDQPIAEYIEGFQMWDEEATKKVTLRDMLCHRTGVGGHDATWPDNNITRIEFLERLQHLEPNLPFRSLAQYSNVMYAAVGGVLEAVTGQKWEEIMREEVFVPLGMTDSYCLMDEVESLPNCARPYWWNQGLQRIPRWNIDMAGPCGSVMSSARDMLNWLSMNIEQGVWQGERLLKEASFQDFHQVQIPMEYPHLKGGHSLGYALGWRVLDYHGHLVQQHTGKIEGYSAFQFYVPEKKSGAVFLHNMHAPLNPLIFTMQGLLLDHFLDREPFDWVSLYTEQLEHAPEDMYHHLEFDYVPLKPEVIKSRSLALKGYVGSFFNPGYGTFQVVEERGGLWLHEREVFYCPIEHFNGDVFVVSGIKTDTDLYKLPLEFLVDKDSQKVISFTIPLEPKVKPLTFVRSK